jgi:hypothetical protein
MPTDIITARQVKRRKPLNPNIIRLLKPQPARRYRETFGACVKGKIIAFDK